MSLEGLSAEEIEALAVTAKALRDNPKTRLGFLRLAKAANPDLILPEVDAEERQNRIHQHVHDRFTKLEEKVANDAAKESAMALYEELRDEGIVNKRPEFNELVKFAVEKGFQPNGMGLRMAKQHKLAEEEAAVPTPTFLSHATPIELDKDLMKNPLQWARRTAGKAIAELNSQRGRK